MERNLYHDDINSPDNPTKTENDMARFENEISRIIKKGFLSKNEVSITLEEDEQLKIFLAIMAFRAKITSKKFGSEMSEESRNFYSKYQANRDFSDFWKRNLGNLVNCRSLREIIEHKEIDDPIKIFFHRDISGHFGRYFIIAERRGPIDFVIGDVYPTIIYGVADNGMALTMYSIFPVSPERALLLANNGVQMAPRNVAKFSNKVLQKPRMSPDKSSIIIRARKVYESEVRYVDSALMKEAREGFAFRDKDRVPCNA